MFRLTNLIGFGGRAFERVTLNPSDKHASATLSNGNLTLTTAGVGFGGVRATRILGGKKYWEVTCDSFSGGVVYMVGISKSGWDFSNYLGSDVNGYGYFGFNGQKYNSGSSSAYGATYTTSDVIGIAFDATNGNLWFAKNGAWQASGDPAAGTNAAFTGLSGAFYPALSDGSNSNSCAMTINFGRTPFSYTPPSDFFAVETLRNTP